MVSVIKSWTGAEADALRHALRMSNEDFAERLGVSVRTVANWRSRPGIVLTPPMQSTMDTALARAPEPARTLFWELVTSREHPDQATVRLLPAPDAAAMTDWLIATDTSDETISRIDRAAAALAEAHTQSAPAFLLAEVSQLQRTVQSLLEGGRLRLRQERELFRINGGLLAHISLLLSDASDNQAADEYGHVALEFFHEADVSEVTAWYVLAKNARWRHHYLDAANLASQGLQNSSLDPMRVQLACYEANASALLGDKPRALHAMAHAEEAAAALPPTQITVSPWSFPPERMTIFRVSVALGTGDPDEALRAAGSADLDWLSAGPHVPAALAQIRVGAAIAHVAKDELEGAAEQVAPVLALPPDLRIATVTGWLANLNQHLSAARYMRDPVAADLRQQIRDFSTLAVTDRPEET
jgi:hypothetical protein